MITQLTSPATQALPPTPNVVAHISPNVGRVPLAASQISQPISAGNTPKNSRSWAKIGSFLLLLIVLTGGIGVAVYLNLQNQDIRQEATAPVNIQPRAFTFQHINPETEVFSRFEGEQGPSTINAKIEFLPAAPSCGVTRSCTAQLRATLLNDEGSPSLPESCTLNTASLSYYRFITNSDDPNYPANLANGITVNGQEIPANCQRPVSGCGTDANCYQPPEVITMYGPTSSQCTDQCNYFEKSLDFNITDLEYGCGCIQFDPNVSIITLNCVDPSNPAEPTLIKYSRTSNNGPWAYGYNNDQCGQPTLPPASTPTPALSPTPQPTNTPSPKAKATPTPTPPPNSTPTPTYPPVGPMCDSISMSPTEPKFGDQVTFTCGSVTGVTEYQFRYFEPNSTTPKSLSTARDNISSPLTINLSGRYRAQCRICPSNADTNNSCTNPTWGWDPVPTP